MPERVAPADGGHPSRPRGGRPTRAQAAQLDDHLLDVATTMLLEHGYGLTTVEAIAQRAQVAKRTFYHRYADKSALMTAVARRLIDRLRPPPGVPLVEGRDLRQQLEHLARLILRAALQPQALALHRLIVAEAQRFPELARAVAQAGGRAEAVGLIAGLLQRHAGAGSLDARQAAFAAEQFLQLVVSAPQLRALGLGEPDTPEQIEQWTRRSVALFLGGCAALGAADPAG